MNYINHSIITLITAIFAMATLSSHADFSWEDHYTITDIPIDENIDPQIGGLDINTKGELVVCFHRGEVAIYNETSNKWRTFAMGLHEPLGLYVEKEGTILVIQRGELTRLHDKDKDGVADFYEVVCNDWGLSGNYHEFTFGLVKDSKKNIYIALGTASNNGGVREEIRGKWNHAGDRTQEEYIWNGSKEDKEAKKKKMARMYARVPYRGCVLQIQPGNLKANVYATGMRTPNGLYMDKNDQLWVTDNQGDWVGSSKIHRIEEGKFHGHPASLLWGTNPPNITPANIEPSKLDSMRVKSALLLPQGDCGNSITQLLPFTSKFTPLTKSNKAAEQLIIGEMNHSRLIRYTPDVVNGKHQGAASHIINTPNLSHGNNRFDYSPDGKSLYVGKTHLSWPGREGIQKITYNGKPYLMVDQLKLTSTGFQFTFNSPITAPEKLTDYVIQSYGTDYHKGYGSKKIDQTSELLAKISINKNVLTVVLKEAPKSGKVYDISLPKQITSELSDISSHRFWYTAHEIITK